MTQAGQTRGTSNSKMREAVCKDCLREERSGQNGAIGADLPEDFDRNFRYNEQAAQVKLERGQTRSDRCKRHRGAHRVNIQGMAVPYIDLQTIGEALGAHDHDGPTGPFGGLGPMPAAHVMAKPNPVDFDKFGFGMDVSHVQQILTVLANPDTRICVVKAGTGTGKSTYMPYRLLDPPDDAPIRLVDSGPIIVTEPRVQATTGVAGFVGNVMSGAGGVGPGYPVGFQVSGDRAHDESCQLIYVTDGTMINWLREGRLSTIGAVIVDEAHERSTNIDFIMGYLKKAIDRYPHLRVIITSATFDERFYQEYFGGPQKVGVVRVDAVKTIGYGFPLFPDLDTPQFDGTFVAKDWVDVFNLDLPLAPAGRSQDDFVSDHFATKAAPLKEGEFAANRPQDLGYEEDLHDTTRKLLPLRFQGVVPEADWKDRMPKVLGEFIVKLVRGLDEAGVYGDILGFLPTGRSIDEAVRVIKDGLGIQGGDDDVATVYALLSSLEADKKVLALAAQVKGDKRKIVISTNLAETSLTVEGVRFVVDSGLIAQEEWNPELVQGGIPTKPHSQAGIRQRWGRVGRKTPGWVFPLYTKSQFLSLSQDTPPGSTRSNLEQLIMTAKLGGISNVVKFDWPAKFLPNAESGVVLDQPALDARENFLAELRRADAALQTSGAVDPTGDPTPFGKELSRSPGLGTAASTIAIMHADRLACVPEVVTILKLLDNTSIVGSNGLLLDSQEWPDEWRLEASERHRALATGCQDDADLVLQVMSVWERAAPGVPPWEHNSERATWARRWWINNDLLVSCANARRTVLEGLSPAMKEEVKRFVEPALARRARGAITRAMSSLEYRLDGEIYRPASPNDPDAGTTAILGRSLIENVPRRLIPLKRKRPPNNDFAYLSNLITLEEWALEPLQIGGEAPTSVARTMQMLVQAAQYGKPETAKDMLGRLQHVWPAGLRVQLDFVQRDGEIFVVGSPQAFRPPAALPLLMADAATEEGAVEEDSEGDEATLEDAAPERDTSWPTPVATEREVDPRRKVEETEIDERDLLACRACEECLRGDLDECTNRVQPTDPVKLVDELASWRERASRNADVSQPRVHATGTQLESGNWYEVVGYDTSTPTPTIRLRVDWRPAGSEYAPAIHPTLAAGDLVEVEVGPELTDHRGDLRVFYHRSTGGRFLLREAVTKTDKQDEQRTLAMSLHRRTTGLLKELTPGATVYAHVIPHAIPGTLTITMLAMLSGHWRRKENRFDKLQITRGDGSTGTAHFYRALVRENVNDRGWATVTSAIQDPSRGLVHLFGIRVNDPNDEPPPDALSKGRPLLMQLRPEVVRLNVGGLSTAALEQVMNSYGGEFYPPQPPLDRTRTRDEQANDEIPDLRTLEKIPAGWELGRRTPMTTQMVRTLVALNPDSQTWVQACWLFWARSHHLQTSTRDGFRLGGSADVVVLPADRTVLSTDDRSQLAAASVRAPVPGHWRATISNEGDRIAELLGAESVFLSGQEIFVTYTEEEAARRAQTLLPKVLVMPAAAVEVEPSVAGKIIGKGGANLQKALGEPGIWIYSYDRNTSVVTVVGEVPALRKAVGNLLRISSGATGRMVVPAGKTGLLIGKGGSTKNDLLSRSGCTYANPVQGSDEWNVQGPSRKAVENFFERASIVVPGVTTEIVGSLSSAVTDMVRGTPVTDPATYGWSSSEPATATLVIPTRAQALAQGAVANVEPPLSVTSEAGTKFLDKIPDSPTEIPEQSQSGASVTDAPRPALAPTNEPRSLSPTDSGVPVPPDPSAAPKGRLQSFRERLTGRKKGLP